MNTNQMFKAPCILYLKNLRSDRWAVGPPARKDEEGGEIYIYIYIEREREREREMTDRGRER